MPLEDNEERLTVDGSCVVRLSQQTAFV